MSKEEEGETKAANSLAGADVAPLRGGGAQGRKVSLRPLQ
jgi:hypothetical protein